MMPLGTPHDRLYQIWITQHLYTVMVTSYCAQITIYELSAASILILIVYTRL